MIDAVWITTGALSVTTGIVGGLVLRQWVAQMDNRRAEKRARR